jgi:hypothetical protein
VSVAASLIAGLRLFFFGPPIASSLFLIIASALRGSDGRASFWFERLDAGQHLFLQKLLLRDLPVLLSLD